MYVTIHILLFSDLAIIALFCLFSHVLLISRFLKAFEWKPNVLLVIKFLIREHFYTGCFVILMNPPFFKQITPMVSNKRVIKKWFWTTNNFRFDQLWSDSRTDQTLFLVSGCNFSWSWVSRPSTFCQWATNKIFCEWT